MTLEDSSEDAESVQDSEASNEEIEEKDEMTLIQERLEEALREKDQFRSIAQRAQADLINYRKRVADEQQCKPQSQLRMQRSFRLFE